MKILDVLIAVLVVLVFASGAFLMYSVVTGPDDSDMKVDDGPVASVCIDNDGDMYGVDCELGLDCDDNDDGRAEACYEVSNALGVQPVSPTYAKGEVVQVAVNVMGLPDDIQPEALQLRIDYDTSILKYTHATVIDDYSPPIDFQADGRVMIDMVNINGIQIGDQPAILNFEAIKTGTSPITVADDSRFEIAYQILGGETSVVIN